MFCQELGAQLARDVLPALSEATSPRVKLIAVGIGTAERGREYCEHVGFTADNL